MLNVKTMSVVYFSTLWILYNVTSISIIVFVPFIILYFLILIYGSFFVGSNFYIKTICSGQISGKKISITFDDGPTEVVTEQILDILKDYGVKATFFCIGKHILNNAEIIKRMDLEGHIVGNHSLSHSYWFDLYTGQRMFNELKETEDIIIKTIGKKTKFFRPPYGVTNPALKKAVNKLDYKAIGWNLKSMDTMSISKEKILSRINRKLKPGNIILFHDNGKKIIEVLQEFLIYAGQKEYQIVGLDELINEEAYE